MNVDRKTYVWFYDHIQSRYYDLVVKWCFLPFGGETRLRDELIRSVDLSTAERILDLCCGTGGSTAALSRRVDRRVRMVGMDLSVGQIRKARARRGLDHVAFVVGDATRAPLRDHSFDMVLIAHALHEMPRELRQMALDETRRLLRDRGSLVVLEMDRPDGRTLRWFVGLWFFYWLPFNFETPTRRDMLEHGLSREIEEAGFRSVTKTSKCNGAFQVVHALK